MTTETVTAEPVATNTVPAGYTIDYFTEPKRMYLIDGEEAVSVTTVLGCLDKPALPWWGMKVGIEGALALYERGALIPAQRLDTEGWGRPALALAAPGFPSAGVDNVVELLTEHKLTVNHQRDKAGDRGIGVHNAFEAWAAIGTYPNPEDYPLEEQGYVLGLCRFIDDTGGHLVPDAQEVIVGSKEHMFAGRYDFRGHTTKEMRLISSALTQKGEPRKRGPMYTTVPGGISILADVKTSKGIYGSHLLQLEGYEGASIESGYEPTDARAVLHVTANGLYEFKRARANYDDFLAILRTYHALGRVEEALKS